MSRSDAAALKLQSVRRVGGGGAWKSERISHEKHRRESGRMSFRANFNFFASFFSSSLCVEYHLSTSFLRHRISSSYSVLSLKKRTLIQTMWATSSRSVSFAVAPSLSIALRFRQSTLLTLRLPSLPCSSCSSTNTPAYALATPTPTTPLATSSPWDIVSLWDGLLRAVPKKKVSHSRKSMRAANKGLKDRSDLVHCSGCGKPKLHHHICSYCYFELNRARKVTLKAQEGAERAVGQSG